MLDNARKRLRKLVVLIPDIKRMPVYTSFADAMGEATVVELPGLSSGVDEQRYRAKVQQYLRSQLNHPVIYKIRWMEPVTSADLKDLEQLLSESGVINTSTMQGVGGGLGLGVFIRSLVGLERDAAKRAFSGFLADKTLTANQLEFVNKVIDHLTEYGAMGPGQLYSSPYTDISPLGPEGLFSSAQVRDIVHAIQLTADPA